MRNAGSDDERTTHRTFRPLALVLVLVSAMVAVASCVPPAPVRLVDVDHSPHGVIGGLVTSNHWRQVQTFTAGRSGQLDEVDLWIQFTGAGTLIVDVYNVTGDHDLGTLLGTGSHVGSSTGEVAVPLSQAATVVAGQRYAVSLRQTEPESSGSWQMSFSSTVPLPGETLYVRYDDHPDVFPGADAALVFRTWVRS